MAAGIKRVPGPGCMQGADKHTAGIGNPNVLLNIYPDKIGDLVAFFV